MYNFLSICIPHYFPLFIIFVMSCFFKRQLCYLYLLSIEVFHPGYNFSKFERLRASEGDVLENAIIYAIVYITVYCFREFMFQQRKLRILILQKYFFW